MTPLDAALALAQEQIDTYNLGTPSQPQPGTVDYYQLRAILVGQAYLLRLRDLGIEGDVAGQERLYKAGVRHFSKAAFPPPEPVVKEQAPAGTAVPPGVPA